jgi:hypothetical protein
MNAKLINTYMHTSRLLIYLMLNIIKVQDEVKTVTEFSALSHDINSKLEDRDANFTSRYFIHWQDLSSESNMRT